MTKPTKKAARRVSVKAWAVIDDRGKVPYAYYISTHRSMAIQWRSTNASFPDGCVMPDIKIVPATLTYSLPRLTKKK